MRNGITDFIDEHKKTGTASGGVIASITLAKLGKKMAETMVEDGAGQTAVKLAKLAGPTAATVVQPAIWVVTRHKPDGADTAYWVLGAAAVWAGEAALGYATAGAKIVKAMVDEETQRLLAQARASEPAECRKRIHACCHYESFAAGQQIEATIIAGHGGTAWQHPNGLWVYILDAAGLLVCDYQPQIAQTIYQPILPLRPVDGGKFKWHVMRGGHAPEQKKKTNATRRPISGRRSIR